MMLRRDDCALLVVDVQGILVRMMWEREIFLKNVQIMIQSAGLLELPLLWVEQYPEGLGGTVPEIAGLLTDKTPIIKKTFNACLNPVFMEELNKLGKKQLLVVGMETHVCVYQTVMGLLTSGYGVQLVTDAVSSRNHHNKEIGLMKMKEAGAVMTSTETVLFELMEIAEGKIFKEFIKLVR